MRLSPIVLKLRNSDTRFGNNIAGVADIPNATENTFTKEVAFVVPLAEVASENQNESIINQRISERFGVIVVLDNGQSDKDKTGLTAFDTLNDVRQEIFRSILGWETSDAESSVSFVSGSLLEVTRSNIWYLYEFSVDTRIGSGDGVQQEDYGIWGYLDTISVQTQFSETD